MHNNDRIKGNLSLDSTTLLGMAELPNDPDKIQAFKKGLEDFLIDEEEDAIGDISQIVPDSRPYDKTKYDSILLNARSSRAICQKFESEPSGLQKSDAQENQFDLESILKRIAEGHKIYKYSYNVSNRKIVTIKIVNGIVEIFQSETNKNRIGFADVLGVTLGAVSSTFRMYKFDLDKKLGLLHSSEDCFSIINEFRSYDFGTTSATAKYDICLSLSWLCSLNNSLQSCVPFTKCNIHKDFLSFKNIRDKLNRDSLNRKISVVELFLVLFT
jgi:hypothetical protein